MSAAIATRRRGRTADEHTEQQATARRTGALDSFAAAMLETSTLEVPPPVSEENLRVASTGTPPKMSAEAFELARQVYYLQHGTRADAARAIIAAGLANLPESYKTDPDTIVYERLKGFWERHAWPQRTHEHMVAIRDANFDGGLFRSERSCAGVATGNGPAPKGKPCGQSPLPDSEYCWQHDPRPEYAAKRAAAGAHLANGRARDMVPLEPLQKFLDRKRLEMLAAVKASGRKVHPNNRGWGLLCEAMGVDQSLILRVMKASHNGAATRNGRGEVRKIRARTVVGYLDPIATFEEVYGFPAPEPPRDGPGWCACGNRKDQSSAQCRDCYEASTGVQCSYTTKGGRRCIRMTKHDSGVCAQCRQVTEHERIPMAERMYRESNLTKPMMLFALMEFRDLPSWQWVAARLWQHDAGGVRAVYSSQKVLTGTLVRQLGQGGRAKHRRRDPIRTPEDAEQAMAPLVDELGELPFPDSGQPADIAGVSLVPIGPFLDWLRARYAEVGNYKKLGRRVRTNPDNISKWLRGVGVGEGKVSIRRATVERALGLWGDGTTFADLYGSKR